MIDAGAEVTTVWSAWRGTSSQPSVVAIDDRGVVRAHGRSALLAAARRSDDRLITRRPFAAGDVVDLALAGSFLRWLLAESAPRGRRGMILFPLPTSTSKEVASHWRRLAEKIGRSPVIAHRPIAVALGLGLSANGGRAHLLIEVTADFVEMGIVARGAVIAERLIHGEPESWASAVEMVGSMLFEIDPDDELDIREEGLYLVARDPQSELLARLLADGLGMPVLVTDAGTHPVVLGARQIVQTMSHYAPA